MLRLKENARIFEDVQIDGSPVIEGWAHITDRVSIEGSPRIYDRAKLWGDVKIRDSVEVYGDAKISDFVEVEDEAEIFGSADLHGKAKVCVKPDSGGGSDNCSVSEDSTEESCNVKVSGNAMVYGCAYLYGHGEDAKVHGDAEILGSVRVYGNAGKKWEETLVLFANPDGDAFGSNGVQISGESRIYGNAKVFGGRIFMKKGWRVSEDIWECDNRRAGTSVWRLCEDRRKCYCCRKSACVC